MLCLNRCLVAILFFACYESLYDRFVFSFHLKSLRVSILNCRLRQGFSMKKSIDDFVDIAKETLISKKKDDIYRVAMRLFEAETEAEKQLLVAETEAEKQLLELKKDKEFQLRCQKSYYLKQISFSTQRLVTDNF